MPNNIPAQKDSKYLKVSVVVLGFIAITLMSRFVFFILKSGGTQSVFQTPSPAPVFFERDQIANEPGLVSRGIPKEFNLTKAENIIETLKGASKRSELFQKAAFEIVYSGTVTAAHSINENLDGVKYVYLIGLTEREEKTIELKIKQAEYLMTQAFFITPKGQTLEKPERIKPGDFVTVKEMYDILDTSSYRRLILEVKSQ